MGLDADLEPWFHHVGSEPQFPPLERGDESPFFRDAVPFKWDNILTRAQLRAPTDTLHTLALFLSLQNSKNTKYPKKYPNATLIPAPIHSSLLKNKKDF